MYRKTHNVTPLKGSDVNKDPRHKDRDQDLSGKDQDKDQDFSAKYQD